MEKGRRSLSGADDRDHDATIGGVAELVGRRGGVLTVRFHEAVSAPAFHLNGASCCHTPAAQALGNRSGTFQRKLAIEFDRTDGVGVTQHPDAVDVQVVLLYLLNQVFNGVEAAGPQFGFAKFMAEQKIRRVQIKNKRDGVTIFFYFDLLFC